jgi:hypothetical protein
MSRIVDADTPFGANSPFYRLIKEGLDGLADGDDYFDLLADDVVFEYVISVPGYPRRVEGRQNPRRPFRAAPYSTLGVARSMIAARSRPGGRVP